MKRNRTLSVALTTVVAAAGLTACSAGGGSDDGPVTITIMEYQQTRIDIVEELIPGFEAEMAEQGRDITVDLVADQLTDEQFRTKITQQFIAGEAPDLVDMGDSFVPGFAGAGYLAPLDDYLEDWDGWDAYRPQFKEASVRQDGQIYSLLNTSGVLNLFYREDVLTELGVDTSQPETWDELIDRLVQVKEATGDTPIVLPAGSAWGGGTWNEGFQPLLGGTDQDYYDAETGTWDLESPGWAAVFDLYAELAAEDLLPTQDLLNPNPWQPTKYEKFPAGEIQVAAQGTWGWKFDWGPEGATPIPDLTEKVSTWQFPGLRDGDEPYGWLNLGGVYTIPEASDHKDEAMLLAQYLTTGEPLAEQLVASGAASPRDDISDVEPYASEPELLQAGVDQETSVFVPTGDGTDQIAQAVATATELVLTGAEDGEGAYRAFVEDATELLGPSLVKQ